MTKFEELLKILQDDQVTPGEISVMVAELIKAASLKLYSQMTFQLTDEEKKQVDDSADDKAAEELLAKLYQQHTGQAAEEAVAELQEQYAVSFLEKYLTEKNGY